MTSVFTRVARIGMVFMTASGLITAAGCVGSDQCSDLPTILLKLGQQGNIGSLTACEWQVLATDAPLDGRQLTRLAKRAALGLARTGSTVRHGSGDFILAFSTANVIPHYPKEPVLTLTHLADTHLNPLIAATVETTEEAILNALTTATT